MKLLSIILFVFLAFTANVKKENSIANVEKISNIPVFVYATPTAEYEVLGKAVAVKSILMIAANDTASVRDKANILIQEALKRKQEGKNPEFDAIIIDPDHDKMRIIKFKGTASTEAEVTRFDEVPLFFFSTPKNGYKTVETLPADMSLYAKRGVLSDKIQSIMNRVIKKKEKGEVKDFDAVIISPDNLSLRLIKFEN